MYYKNMQYYVFENQFFTHFFSAVYVTHMEENELYWKLFYFISFYLVVVVVVDDFHDGPCCYFFFGDWVILCFFFLLLFFLLQCFIFFFINDEVKRKERKKKKRVECLNIFSTHNMLFYFISYVRNVIVVEGQYFTRIFFVFYFTFFFNFGFLNYIQVYSQYIYTSLCRVNVRKKTKRKK